MRFRYLSSAHLPLPIKRECRTAVRRLVKLLSAVRWRDSITTSRCLAWLLASVVVLALRAGQAQPAMVQVQRMPGPSAVIDEAIVRVVAELAGAGFTASVVTSTGAPFAALVQSQRAVPGAASSPQPLAVISLTMVAGVPQVEVRLDPSLGPTSARVFAAQKADARTLAIVATELLRASLLDVSENPANAKRLPADVARWVGIGALPSAPDAAAGDGGPGQGRAVPGEAANRSQAARSSTLIGAQRPPQRPRERDTQNVARSTISASAGVLVATGGWPAALLLTAKARLAVTGGWSVGALVGVAPFSRLPISLAEPGGGTPLGRELYLLQLDYTIAAPDDWVVPRVGLDLGSLRARLFRDTGVADSDNWVFAGGAHAGLAFQLTDGLALHSDVGVLLTQPALKVRVDEHNTNLDSGSGFVSVLLEAGASARF